MTGLFTVAMERAGPLKGTAPESRPPLYTKTPPVVFRGRCYNHLGECLCFSVSLMSVFRWIGEDLKTSANKLIGNPKTLGVVNKWAEWPLPLRFPGLP